MKCHYTFQEQRAPSHSSVCVGGGMWGRGRKKLDFERGVVSVSCATGPTNVYADLTQLQPLTHDPKILTFIFGQYIRV